MIVGSVLGVEKSWARRTADRLVSGVRDPPRISRAISSRSALMRASLRRPGLLIGSFTARAVQCVCAGSDVSVRQHEGMSQTTWFTRPYVAVDSLDELRGPTDGIVTLPRRLDLGPQRPFDLRSDRHLVVMYETVLNEARRVEDVRAFINGRVLVRLWPELTLPPDVRSLWESRIPQLRERSAA